MLLPLLNEKKKFLRDFQELDESLIYVKIKALSTQRWWNLKTLLYFSGYAYRSH